MVVVESGEVARNMVAVGVLHGLEETYNPENFSFVSFLL